MKVLLKVNHSLLVLQDVRGFHSSFNSLEITEGDTNIVIKKNLKDAKGVNIEVNENTAKQLSDNLFLEEEVIQEQLKSILCGIEQQTIFEEIENRGYENLIVIDYELIKNDISEGFYDYGITIDVELLRGEK